MSGRSPHSLANGEGEVATLVTTEVARRPAMSTPRRAAVGRAHRRRRYRHGRWSVAGAVLVGYGLQVLWRLWLVRHLNAPAAHGDEDGYLLVARVLAGGPGGHTTQNEGFIRYGYSLLITPAYWFSPDAFAVYRHVQLLDALLNAVTLPLAYLLGRRVLRLPPGWAIGAAMLAASLPAVAFYGEFALSDVITAPIGLAWLLALSGWLRSTETSRRWAWAVAAGAAAGFGFTVHVRFSVVVLVHLAVVLVMAVRRLTPMAPAAASFAALSLTGGLNRLLGHAIGGAMTLDGRDGTAGTWHTLGTLGGLSVAGVNGAGQLWYLMISTWGLGAVGLIVGAGRVLRSIRRLDAAGMVVAAALAATLGVALASAAALPPDGRATYHAYPRYLAFLAPFWLLVGVAAVLRRLPESPATALRHGRYALTLAAGGALLMAGLGAVVLFRFRGILGHETFLGFDAPEASWLSHRWDRLALARASAAAGALLIGAVLLLRTRRWAALALAGLILVNVVALGQITQRISEPMVRPQYATAPSLAKLGVHPGDRVVSSTRVTWWVRYNHAREVWWAPVTLFQDDLVGVPAAATVVIAPSGYGNPLDNWDGTHWGWVRVGGSVAQYWSVWRRAGDP